jgi:hypothetical protein
VSPRSGQHYAHECARNGDKSLPPGQKLTVPPRLEIIGADKEDAVPMFAIHRRTHVLGRAIAAILPAALITATYAALIPAGPNYFETVSTGTSMDFSRTNISRGFFDPGSDSFLGFIRLQGVPIDPTTLGTTDTIVQRLFDIKSPRMGSRGRLRSRSLPLVLWASIPSQSRTMAGRIPNCGMRASRSSPIKSSGGG